MADQNIANAIDSGAGSLEASIPVWGGIADMLQGRQLKKNMGLISGEACVTRNKGEGLGDEDQVFTWDEAKYYQRFVEDQRLAENMGLVEESSVSVALRHYYEKNPIDDSLEGLLSYYSGMSKEKVADTLDMVEGMLWIASYHPNGLYPLYTNNMSALEKNKKMKERDGEVIGDFFITSKKAYFMYRKEYTIG